MRKPRNRLLCLVLALGVGLMAAQVSADREWACCDLNTGACETVEFNCFNQYCVGQSTCAGEVSCSVLMGDCYIPGVGCITVNQTCWDLLDCTSCTLPSEPDDSGDESVKAEQEGKVDSQSTLSWTALLIFFVMALPAVPMIIRRWPVRK